MEDMIRCPALAVNKIAHEAGFTFIAFKKTYNRKETGKANDSSRVNQFERHLLSPVEVVHRSSCGIPERGGWLRLYRFHVLKEPSPLIRAAPVPNFYITSQLEGHNMPVRSLVFSPELDSCKLYSVSDDGHMHIYEVEGKAIIGAMSGHSGWVLSVDVMSNHMDQVWAVAFRPGGRGGRVDSKAVNETRQITSYSRSTRSRLDKYSDRMDSTRARARLEFLTSRNELLDIRLEKLMSSSKKIMQTPERLRMSRGSLELGEKDLDGEVNTFRIMTATLLKINESNDVIGDGVCIEKLRKGRLRWFEHVLRRQPSDAVRRVESITVNGARRRGRPRRK
ncbi:Hydroxyproline-rich glycoprotein family protein [Hibiscus syriacus]|uniref:Hydroxyproline-rich glycoprotein family protein n=1 Tax=Hibiscus syriacus TaxID=106335 RepID=A0A6A2X7V3_HIBSY|nr:Hydroxyproline-rich glycoprotein family protein [Hibiscus syriacus]